MTTWERVWQFLTKLNIYLPSNSPKRNENKCLQKVLFMNINSNFICYGQNLETTQMYKWLDEQTVIQLHSRTLLRNEKGWMTAIPTTRINLKKQMRLNTKEWYSMVPFISNSRKEESNYRNRKQVSGCLGLEVRWGFTETSYRNFLEWQKCFTYTEVVGTWVYTFVKTFQNVHLKNG